MTQRVNFSILFCTISILTAQAQWNKQDSIRLQELLNGDGELKINTEAVKSIHFDFQSDKDNIKGTPIMSEDKPWMKFLKDLPKNFGDTTKWVRPNFVRLTPYTPYTTWHEDPVNDPIFLKRKDSLTISWKLNIYNPQIQISAESETKRSIFREKDKTKRSKKESAQHSKSRNKSFVMTSVSAL